MDPEEPADEPEPQEDCQEAESGMNGYAWQLPPDPEDTTDQEGNW